MATSEHPDEAKELIAFLATDGGKLRFETTGDLPLDSKVAEEVNWANDLPGRPDILELAQHARPAIFIPNRWDVFGPLSDAWGYLVGVRRQPRRRWTTWLRRSKRTSTRPGRTGKSKRRSVADVTGQGAVLWSLEGSPRP